MEKDLIIDSFKRCITDTKCLGCEWKTCQMLLSGQRINVPRISIPVDLALAVIALLADKTK